MASQRIGFGREFARGRFGGLEKFMVDDEVSAADSPDFSRGLSPVSSSGWLGKIILISMAFVAGLLIGAGGMYRVITKQTRSKLDSETWSPRTIKWLDKELKLTTEERLQCEPVVGNAVQQLIKLRDESEKERKTIVGMMFVELYAILPTDKRDKLKEAVRKGRDSGAGLGREKK